MQQLLPKICIAQPHQVGPYQNLVRNIYCKRLNWVNEDEAQNLFADGTDSDRTVLVISTNEELAGGMSLVKSSNLGFPHEGVLKNLNSYLANSGSNREKLREVNRLAAKPGGLYALMPHLIKALYWFGLSRELKGYCMAIDMKVFLYCHKLGVSLSPIAIPAFCEGSWVVPAVLDLARLEDRLITANHRLWKYLKDKTNVEEALTLPPT